MSSKKEEKGDAADRVKAAALTAAKGLSRAQAERAATAAARNVNAYGQKEEGPSRWQERKEAKRQMYLMSTEKAVKLGERKDLKNSMASSGGVSTEVRCQKCFQAGHWTYECKNERVYITRPSRTQQLKNPKLRMKLCEPYEIDNPTIPKEERGKWPTKKSKESKSEKATKKSKMKHHAYSDSGSDSDSDTSVSKTESDSSSGGSSSNYSSSSDEEERRRRKRKQRKRTHRKYRSSSESSDSDSASDSDSDDKKSRKKSNRHAKRH